MRILQALVSPWGVLGLALLSLTFGLVPAMLDQADIRIPALAYVFGILALAFGLGAIAAFVASWIRADGTQEPETQVEHRRKDEYQEWREQDALEAYRTQMEQWLHDQSRPLRNLERDDEVRASAQERTLTVLERLGPNGKRNVLRFIHRHRLIVDGNAILSMDGADLSGVNLSGMSLTDADLEGANLRGADLSHIHLFGFLHASGARAMRAIERGGGLMDLAEPTRTSSLVRVDLSGAVLKHAKLMHCSLLSANLAGADLDRADLRGTDLRRTRNLTQEQIERAYGSSGQQEYMPDTMLPDHLHAPGAWQRLYSQQVEEREQSQGGSEP